MLNSSDVLVPLPNTAFSFLSRADYFAELIKRATSAQHGDRLLIMTHTLEVNEPPIAALMAALSAAAKRGASVDLLLDERTFPIAQRLPATRAARDLVRSTQRALKDLQAAGGRYAITNKSYRRVVNRFAGRSHIKVAIYNDEVFVGGCNLTDVTHIDLMVHWRDAKASQWLYDQMQAVMHLPQTRLAFKDIDLELPVDPQTKLLLDAGKPKQSIIFKHALELIDSAQQWVVLTCQFFPNNVTARHLAQAYRRGVNVSIYFNHPAKHPLGHNILHHVVLIHERSKHPAALFEQRLHKDLPFLHAKLLATDQGAMIGSHNYVAVGVNFGTAELALLRHNSEFARASVKRFLDEIASLQR